MSSWAMPQPPEKLRQLLQAQTAMGLPPQSPAPAALPAGQAVAGAPPSSNPPVGGVSPTPVLPPGITSRRQLPVEPYRPPQVTQPSPTDDPSIAPKPSAGSDSLPSMESTVPLAAQLQTERGISGLPAPRTDAGSIYGPKGESTNTDNLQAMEHEASYRDTLHPPELSDEKYQRHGIHKVTPYLIGALGALASFGNPQAGIGYGKQFARRQFNRDTEDYENNVADVTSRIADRGKLASSQAGAEKVETLEQRALETTRANQAREELQGQLNGIKDLVANNQHQEALSRLEQSLQSLNNKAEFQQNTIENQRDRLTMMGQIAQMVNQVKEGQLDLERQKLSTTTNAKALDGEEKQAVQQILDYQKQHPFLSLLSNPQKDIDTIHKLYQDRREAIGIGAGSNPAAPPPPAPPPNGRHTAPGAPPPRPSAPTPQTHVWSKSAWKAANPSGDADAAEKQAHAQNWEVRP